MERVSPARRPPASKFRRLAVTHALMTAGDAAMVVALADSLFFDIDLDAARSRVMLFLVVGFAPFLVVAPLIGPFIDRVAGGRRFVIQVVAVARVVLSVLMAQYLDALALFPLVFGALVLQKTYVVSKSAIVPSTVRSDEELVEANSKLGLISGLTGAVAVIPAGILLNTAGASSALIYAALLFGAAFVAATKLSPDVVAADAVDAEEVRELHTSNVRLGAISMTVLRGMVGFTFFHLAFWLRSQDSGALWFGAVVGVSALASMVGNAIALAIAQPDPRGDDADGLAVRVCRRRAPGGRARRADRRRGPRRGPESDGRPRAARASRASCSATRPARTAVVPSRCFETRFQLAWAMGAFVAVAIQVPGQIGFLIVGAGRSARASI